MSPAPGLGRIRVSAGKLAAVVVLLFVGSRPAPASFPKITGGAFLSWKAGSPSGIWNDGTKTLTWALYTGNFPQPNLPTAAQAGAALQNSFQSLADVLGKTIRFAQDSDTGTPPMAQDGKITLGFFLDESQDFYFQDLTNPDGSSKGILGVTYITYDTNTGTLIDADIEVNADPGGPAGAWSSNGAAATSDIQNTVTHEAMHLCGSLHSIYFGSMMFPYARNPKGLLQDRCLSPDDRSFFRTVYPDAAQPTQLGGQISGTVKLSTPATPVTPADRACVVATDLKGVPQAITVTAADGTYSMNVPAGTYTLTACHGFNSVYDGSSAGSVVDFTGASDFISSTPIAGVVVSNGGNITPAALVANNPGTAVPHMKLELQSVLPANPGFQDAFVTPGQSATMRLMVNNSSNGAQPVLSTANITNVTIGTGSAGDITVAANSWTASPGPVFADGPRTYVDVPFTVPANAAPGFRNVSITLNINSNESLFVPGTVKVVGSGGLTVSPAVNNPPTKGVALSAVNVPLLRFQLQSTAAIPSNSEDLRIRKLTFDIAGTGPTLPAVRLWLDVGTAGVVDGADTRLFTGGAYAAVPIGETISFTPTGPLTLDDLCIPVLDGQTINLLLTADMPATGSGDYTASITPATGIVTHGMFWGDVCNPTGATVTGGTQSVGAPAVGALQQLRTTGLVDIPVGGFTPETQVSCRGTVTASSGTQGLEVEVKPLGTAFTGTGTVSSATTFANGSVITLNIPGLTNQTSYHWRARAISGTLQPSPWVSFGANAESEADFSVDSSTTNPPSALFQVEVDGATPVPLGGLIHGAIILGGTSGTNSAGLQVRLEVEAAPAGTAFTNSPSIASGFGLSGGAASVLLSSIPTGDYHWQARTVNAFGVPSTWVNFDAAPIHFHMEAIVEIKADGGCAGRASDRPTGSWVFCLGAALGLVLLGLKRKAATGFLALLLVAGLSTVARADETEISLPTSLSASPFEFSEAARLSAEPLRPPAKSWISLDAYLGVLFMDFDFDTLGTDFVRRQVSGIGTAALGVEGLVEVLPDWRVGLAAEVDMWSDLRILAVGPVVTWRFSGSHRSAVSGQTDTEHFLKLGVYYEKLEISKTGFGDFDPTVGVRLGYELRLGLSDRWNILLGASLQYSQWNYSETTLGGDDKIGGFGGLISVGISWLP
jgi:hypothetical protein